MTSPVRIQLSRQRGFNLQRVSLALNGLAAVNCARPTQWGNAFRVGIEARDAAHAVELHRRRLTPRQKLQFKAHLRGKNLACWCELDQPCHCDSLRRIANS